MENQFSFKELEQVVLKSTYSIEINGRKIAPGEVIAYFDRIQIANFDEIKRTAKAHGGFDDRALVIWESIKGINFSFAQGIFNREQFGIMLNAKLIENSGENLISIHQRDSIETDDNGYIYLSKLPYEASPIFIYNTDGEKIDLPSDLYIEEDEKGYRLVGLELEPYQNLIVDYNININGGVIYKIGKLLLTEWLTLEGRTRVQEDISGNFKTGIITIPKLRLMSDLSIRLGSDATPIVGSFNAMAVPVGERGVQEVMKITFLNEDIDIDKE